jgi:hypothetical protein
MEEVLPMILSLAIQKPVLAHNGGQESDERYQLKERMWGVKLETRVDSDDVD